MRGTITSEMWETLNSTWIEARDQSFDKDICVGRREFFEWVKLRSHLSWRRDRRYLVCRTEAYHFIRLGTLLERADNTARILDVKYHVLRPQGHESGTDFYQWARCCGPISALRTIAKVYRDVIPRAGRGIADSAGISAVFALLPQRRGQEPGNGGQSALWQIWASGYLHARLHYARVGDILEQGVTQLADRFHG